VYSIFFIIIIIAEETVTPKIAQCFQEHVTYFGFEFPCQNRLK